MNILIHRLLLATASIALINCSGDLQRGSELTSNLYHNGDIVTMSGDVPQYVEALVTEGDRIVFVGQLTDAEDQFGTAQKIDLEGQTMLPGFIDGHAHFTGFLGQGVGAQILPPPDANANNMENLVRIMQEWATPENIELTGWIFGMGFDDSVLEEKRFPTKDDLDQVSLEHPVMAIHISGHFIAVNSKGLEILGIDESSPDPEGGIIRRVPGTKQPNGVLEELAAIPYMMQVISPTNQQTIGRFLEAGQEMAVSYGYTTVQEGRAMAGNHAMLTSLAEQDRLLVDVVSYLDYTVPDSIYETNWYSTEYQNHYRIAGMKLTLDGSPQGRTAWITHPYLVPPEGVDPGYSGYPAIPNDDDVVDIYERAFKNNYQILTHANGDAAVDQMIRTMSTMVDKYGNENRRNVLIHGQYVRGDQLDSLKDLQVIASLFPMHTFYWGDWHKQLIGDSLGNKISPTRTALDKGLKLTIHTDAPVALPNLMRMVWTATQRVSRSGQIIGEEERLTVYEALKCITEWSAYQHFEEGTKGTLEVGKLADLVILDQNPLKVDPEAVKDIVVMETIKEGSTVYRR